MQLVGPDQAPEPLRRQPSATDRLWIADGKMLPVRDQGMASSSWCWTNVQVAINVSTHLAVATGQPRNVNDAQALRRFGIAEVRERRAVLTNGVY